MHSGAVAGPMRSCEPVMAGTARGGVVEHPVFEASASVEKGETLHRAVRTGAYGWGRGFETPGN